MSLENSNYQNNSSEDQLGEMQNLTGGDSTKFLKSNLHSEIYTDSYAEKIAILTPAIMELENYIEAIQNIEEVENKFNKMNRGTLHVNQSEFIETGNTLNRYRQVIHNYESQYPKSESLEIEKSELVNLKDQRKQLRLLQEQFNNDAKNYKKN